MIKQYFKFFINGGILGVIAWGLQLTIYQSLGGSSSLKYAIAAALTYLPLIVANFIIQRKLIFKQNGTFGKFIMANLLIMLLIKLKMKIY